MVITIKYFGILSEITNKDTENLIVEDNCNSNDINKILIETYPSISNVNYIIAVNQNVIQNIYSLSPNDEIALLPPFSGG
ncbi:MAG: MoaD/ThiS family protein [Saprospiraceae bacterium]|nr:MoaD/ThiS family protein [Saprospiraceae bacterium]